MGTRVEPVFKYLKEEVKGSERPDLLVYFTDGYAESHIDEKYHINPSTKLMWVLTGRKKDLSVNNPMTNRIKELKMYDHH